MIQNHKDSKVLHFPKYVPVVFLYLFAFPCNYSGHRLGLRNRSFQVSTKETPHKVPASLAYEVHVSSGEEGKEMRNILVNGNFVVIALLVLIMTTIFLSLILGYLGSVSTVKHCLMLYLYREVVQTFLIMNWIWAIAVVICKVNGNGRTLDTSSAKVIAYIWDGVSLHLLMTFNLMAFLKLYMTKENVLDPSMP